MCQPDIWFVTRVEFRGISENGKWERISNVLGLGRISESLPRWIAESRPGLAIRETSDSMTAAT